MAAVGEAALLVLTLGRSLLYATTAAATAAAAAAAAALLPVPLFLLLCARTLGTLGALGILSRGGGIALGRRFAAVVTLAAFTALAAALFLLFLLLFLLGCGTLAAFGGGGIGRRRSV